MMLLAEACLTSASLTSLGPWIEMAENRSARLRWARPLVTVSGREDGDGVSVIPLAQWEASQ